MAKPVWKKLIELSDKQIAKMQSDRTEIAKLYKSARRSYVQRKSQFTRRGAWSPAVDVYEYIRPFKEGEAAVLREKIDPEEVSPQRLYHEVMALKKFFESKTSTIEGLHAHMRNVEQRIFGWDTDIQLSYAEHKELWRVFAQWESQYKEKVGLYGSTRIQTMIGNLITGRDVPKEFSNFNQLGLADKAKILNKYLEGAEVGDEDESIHSEIRRRL